MRDNWGDLLGDALDELLARMLLAIDVITQEERGLHLRFGGGGDGGAGAFQPGSVRARRRTAINRKDATWQSSP